eukprot:435520_1
MGALCNSCVTDDGDHESIKQSHHNSNMTKETMHIAFNEICLPDTKFQGTLITTKNNETGCIISNSQNIEIEDLYNAGKRLSDCTKLTSDNEFYVLIRKYEHKKVDKSEIQKYKLSKTNNNQINIKFVETTFSELDKNEDINMEGIEFVESDNKLIGFLLCNDYYAKPPNSNVYFLNIKGEKKLIHSFNDEGILEINGIIQYNSFGKDGYFILPQFLGLSERGFEREDRNTNKFRNWSLENNENAFIYFISKINALQLITCDNEKKENENVMEKIYVVLNDNYKS